MHSISAYSRGGMAMGGLHERADTPFGKPTTGEILCPIDNIVDQRDDKRVIVATSWRHSLKPDQGKAVTSVERNPAPESLLPLHPLEFQILLALSSGVLHGYDIIRIIEEHAADGSRLHVANLYRRIRHLAAAGLIREASQNRPQPDDNRERKYFSLTPYGRRVATAEARRLEALVSQARRSPLATQGGRG